MSTGLTTENVAFWKLQVLYAPDHFAVQRMDTKEFLSPSGWSKHPSFGIWYTWDSLPSTYKVVPAGQEIPVFKGSGCGCCGGGAPAVKLTVRLVPVNLNFPIYSELRA